MHIFHVDSHQLRQCSLTFEHHRCDAVDPVSGFEPSDFAAGLPYSSGEVGTEYPGELCTGNEFKIAPFYFIVHRVDRDSPDFDKQLSCTADRIRVITVYGCLCSAE